MLATLKEYAESVRPKVVLWFYFEGNDLIDLRHERQSPLLSRYLVSNQFSQHLSSRQDEIDRALGGYLDTVANNPLLAKLEEASVVIADADKLPNALQSILKLSQLRQRLGLMYGMTSNTFPEIELERTPITWVPEIDPFYEVLLRARKLVSQWGGHLYFVYLPGGQRYVEKHVNTGRPAVRQAVNKAGVPVIDLHPVFKEQGDPLVLFSLRLPHQHYSEKGHRLVAQSVLGSISVGD
jgi:hypothetical protein